VAELSATILAQLQSWAGLEGIAVVAAVLYLVLAIRQNIACWYFAGLSTAIYVAVLFDARLYMDSALNGFYFLMAVYGWFVWQGGADREKAISVTSWKPATHLAAIATVFVVSGISGFLLDRLTDAAFPYIDSMTTWSAIWATFLVARKVLENWWYWLAIDLASIAIYWQRDLELTALLFCVYVVMIPFGLVSWRRSMQQAAT
jgi:nicotinamide mononucleotide transporter